MTDAASTPQRTLPIARLQALLLNSIAGEWRAWPAFEGVIIEGHAPGEMMETVAWLPVRDRSGDSGSFMRQLEKVRDTAEFIAAVHNHGGALIAAAEREQRLSEALDAARRELQAAANRFAEYERHHRAKDTAQGDGKAEANREWAERMRAARDAASAALAPPTDPNAETIATLLSPAAAECLRRGYDDGQSSDELVKLGLILDSRGIGRSNRYLITRLGARVQAILKARHT